MNSHLKKLFTLCFLIGSHQLFLGQNFVSTWNTSSAGGTLSNTEIIIEANESLVYNYDVDWDNDGTFDEFGITGDITHDFGAAGTYTIEIRGTFPAMNFGNDPTNSGHKLSSIDLWGTIEWTTFNGAFTNCSNLLINATDTPDLSKVTSLNEAFRNCTNLDYSFENWDVSTITDMTNMLDGVTLSTSNYDNTLINWSSQSLQTGVVFSAGNSNYCSGQSSKNDIINNFGWNITDAGTDNTVLPNAICKDTTISLSGDGIFELNESHLDGGSFHNCSNLSFTVSDPILDCSDANLTVSRTLTVSDENGNDASCTSNITILDTNTPVIICPSDTTFGANQTGCIGTYTWSTPDLPCAAAGVFAPIPSGSNFNIGTTTVQLFALDAGFSQIASCSFNVTVEDNFSVSIDSSSNPLCAGSNDGEIYISTTEGQAPFTFDWNNDGTGDSDDLEDITNAIDGLNSVGITDNVGCTATASTTLTEPSALALSFTKTDETRTIQGSIDLSISGGTLPYTYDWDNDGTNDFDDSEDLTNIVPGDYTVTVRDDNGCSITQLVTILDLEPAFITTWKTDNAGVSSTTSITIPTNPSTSLVYDYDIDWDGDGVYDEFNVTGDITHDYGTAGTYEVRIRGNFPSLFFDNGGDADKLLDVNQFGSIQWESFYSAFRGCSNITTFSATDTPDMTLVTSMRTAFANCENFDSNIENWDVSNVSNFYGTFQGASSFNQPLGNWNMISAVNLEYMLSATSLFNQPLDNWNVSNVQRFTRLFQNATSFNQDLNSWNTSSGTSFQLTFEGAIEFNGLVSNWDLSSANTMQGMFLRAYKFNQDVSNWQVGNISNFSSAFSQARIFNQDVTNWDVSNGTNFEAMFNHAFDFDQDLSSWDVSSGQNFKQMFRGILNTDYNYYLWDIANMTEASEMFSSTTISTPLYDSLLINWNEQLVQNDVPFGGGNSVYCLGAEARANLENTFGWTITDGGGETTSPTALCQDTTVVIGVDGTFELTIDHVDAGSTDNCGNLTSALSTTNFTCADIGIHDITVTFTDDVGNSSTCISRLTLNDTSATAITCPNDIQVNAGVSDCRAVVTWNEPTITCELVSYTADFAKLDTFDVGVTTVTYTALDNINTAYTCTFDIEVTNPIQLTSTSQNSCFENNTGSIDLTVLNAIAPYLVDWSNDSIGEFDDPEDISDLLANEYYLAIEDNIGCTAFDAITIGSFDTLGLSYTTVDQDINNGTLGSIDLSITGTAVPFLYDWNTDGTGDFDDTEDLSNLLGGTYGITVQDANLCEVEAFIYVDDGTNPFVTVWNTENDGVSNSSSITIPTNGSYTYNYDIDWDGDGVYDEFGLTGDATHEYPTPGTYTVRIKGDFPAIMSNNQRSDLSTDRLKLLDVSNWGGIEWESFAFAFKGCQNMTISATDAPNLANVTSMHGAFAGCSIMNTDLNHWNVETITNFKSTFQGCELFNLPLDNWNVGQGIDFENMFRHCDNFNQDLNTWNMTSAEDVNHMFQGADNFNGDISNWNTLNVTNFNDMFRDARSFNQDLSQWNVGSGTSFRLMFDDCVVFTSDLSQWDMSSATNLGAMFRRASVFTSDLNGWDVSNVTNFGWTFASAVAFDSQLSNWDVSSATDMQYMFIWARNFDDDIGDWDVSNVTDAQKMFDGVTLSTPNYDSLLIGWNRRNLQPNVSFSGGGSVYCLGADARANMIAADGWVIRDGGGEDIAPTAICQDATLTLDLNGELILEGDVLDGGSTDNCGSLTYTYDQAQFNCGDDGTYIITMTIADNVGNQASCTANLTVVDPAIPSITCPSDTTIGGSTTNCAGIAVWDEPQVTCPIVSYTSDIQRGDVVPLGNTTVTYTALDNANNSYTCQFDVIVESPLSIVLDSLQDISCEDQVFEGAVFTSILEGTEPFQYNWNNAGFENSASRTDLESGPHTVLVQDANGCETTTSFNIAIGSLVSPDVEILHDSLGCLGDDFDFQLNLENVQNFTAEWFINNISYAGNLTDTSITINNLSDSDEVSVIITLDDECTSEATIDAQSIVSLVNPPTITFTYADSSFCEGASIVIEPSSVSYDNIIWYDENGNDIGSSASLTINNPGSYTAEVFRSPCSSVTSTPISIGQIDLPVISLDEYYSFFESENGVDVSASISPETSTFEWSLNDEVFNNESLELTLNPNQTSTYTITANNQQCSSEASTTVEVLLTLKIPEMITPNGDGVNDEWLLEGSDNYPQLYVALFDRWGGKIFEKQSGTFESWNGERNGKDCPDGVYFFIVRASDDAESIKGTLTLAR